MARMRAVHETRRKPPVFINPSLVAADHNSPGLCREKVSQPYLARHSPCPGAIGHHQVDLREQDRQLGAHVGVSADLYPAVMFQRFPIPLKMAFWPASTAQKRMQDGHAGILDPRLLLK